MVGDTPQVIEGTPGPREEGSWFHRHRLRIVIWVAVIEGIAIWATHGLHITTILVVGLVAVACLMLYRFTTERTQWKPLHEATWFLAASQLGATVLVAAGVILIPALVILLVIFALLALGLLFLGRR
jgi:hypothetical protein